MWFMLILWKSFRGLWRLVIGLIIGVILYIVTFTNPGLEWIFNDVFKFSHGIVAWLSEQSWFAEYEKWNNLVKPGDRLPLILYVLVGRFIWLMFEAILFTFPYWLFIGRNKQKKTPDSGELASIAPKKDGFTQENVSASSQGMAPVMGHSGVDAAVAPSVAAPAGAIATGVQGNKETISARPTGELGALRGTGENLERHIDEALAKIKQVRQQNLSRNDT